MENTGAGGHAGIQEVLKNGLVESLAQDAKIAKETSQVNKLLEQIIKLNADYALLDSCDEFSREHGNQTELAKITQFLIFFYKYK